MKDFIERLVQFNGGWITWHCLNPDCIRIGFHFRGELSRICPQCGSDLVFDESNAAEMLQTERAVRAERKPDA